MLVGTVIYECISQRSIMLLFHYLLQCCKTEEHGIRVLTKDGNTMLANTDGMTVKLLAHHYLGLRHPLVLIGMSLYLFAASHYTQAYGHAICIFPPEEALHAINLQH